MRPYGRFTLLLGAALAYGSAPLAAQDPQVEPPLVPADSIEAALSRFQTLQDHMASVQQEALDGSTELQAEQIAVQEAVEAAMFESHPELEPALRMRVPELQRETQEAQEAQDGERLDRLAQEYQAIMSRVQAAEATVLERADIRARLDAFQVAVMAAMRTIDPEIDGVFEETQALAARLERTLGT